MLTISEPYMLLEEKLITHFDNLASSESHFSCQVKKKTQQYLEDSERGMLRNEIHQECTNTEFQKGGVQTRYPVIERSQTNKIK